MHITSNKPSQGLIGIAGTCGKTMTGLLLKHILTKAENKGDFVESWPGRENLSRFFYLYKEEQKNWLSLEVSEQGLAKGIYKNLPFSMGILTNLYPYPKSDNLDKYIKLHNNFFSLLGEEGIAIVNADDPLALETADATSGQIVTYALRYPKSMVTVENYRPYPFGSSFKLVITNELPMLNGSSYPPSSFDVRLPIPGEVGVYTALAAITCALIIGVNREDIVKSLKSFPMIRRRLELLYSGDFTIIDDVAPNPKAVKALFESLTPLSFQRIFIIYGLEKENKSNIEKIALEFLNQEAKQPITEIFLTSGAENLTDLQQAGRIEEISFTKEWQNRGRAEISLFRELTPTIEEALLSLKRGDLLLLLGGKTLNLAGELLSQVFQEDLFIDNQLPIPQKENPRQGVLLNPT